MTTPPRLQVDRTELIQTLKSISRLIKANSKAEAVLSFDEETLQMELPGMSVGVAAKGEWPGRARVAATFLQMMARVPPTTDPVSFAIADGRLKVDGSATNCTWEADSGNRIALPLNPPFQMILSTAYHYTPDDIEKSGLKDLVADAEKQRDKLIGQALSHLNEFGVTKAELRALVDAKMRGTSRP